MEQGGIWLQSNITDSLSDAVQVGVRMMACLQRMQALNLAASHEDLRQSGILVVRFDIDVSGACQDLGQAVVIQLKGACISRPGWYW